MCSQATIWAGRKSGSLASLLSLYGVIQWRKWSGAEMWGCSGFIATMLYCVLMFLGFDFTDEEIGVHICMAKGAVFDAGDD